MVEQQKQRVEQEMTKLVDELDKSYLRRMQGDMHRCAAQCCDNTSYSLDRTHSCIENCGAKLNNANTYVQGELTHLQNRLQRCIMQCNDDIRDMMGPNPSQELADKCSNQFDKCAVRCVDKHVDSIPNMLKTMKTVLAKGPSGNSPSYS